MNKEIQKLAMEARKPKVVFDCSEYTISRIPHNYRIDIKPYCSPKRPQDKIDRDCYSDPENGLDHAKQVAEDVIDDYFVRDKGVYQARIIAKFKNKEIYHGHKISRKTRGK